MAAKASSRIENNTDKKKESSISLKIVIYNFFAQNRINFCNYEKPLLIPLSFSSATMNLFLSMITYKNIVTLINGL